MRQSTKSLLAAALLCVASTINTQEIQSLMLAAC